MPLHLKIVTPEAVTFAGDVEQVTLPGVEGEFGVLPGHEPFVTQIEPGELDVIQGGNQLYLAVGEGFVEIHDDHVAVLTDMAVRAEDIKEDEVEEARRRAEKALAEKPSPEEAASLRATIQQTAAKLRVKQHRRRA
jgi:F-type H+-transporting ATPase subunit epsilon